MTPVKIRSAELRDLDIVYRFLCSLSEKIHDREKFEEYYKINIQQHNYIYLVTEVDESVVGFLSCHGQVLLHHVGWAYEIQEMYTDEMYRGKGIGKLLIQELERILTEREYDVIEVTSNNKRLAAHDFYMKNGYVQTHQKFTKK